MVNTIDGVVDMVSLHGYMEKLSRERYKNSCFISYETGILGEHGMTSVLAYKDGVCYTPKRWMRYCMHFTYILNDVAVVRLPIEIWEDIK